MNEYDEEDNGFIDNRCAFSLLRRLKTWHCPHLHQLQRAQATYNNNNNDRLTVFDPGHAGKIKYNEYVHVKQ